MQDALIFDAAAALDQGVALLNRLTAEQYMMPHRSCFNSSIGGHIRHNLDHYDCFLAGLAGSKVDYDARSRDRLVETDPRHAAARMHESARALKELNEGCLTRELWVKMDSGSEENATTGWASSTGRRELQFLISHTIHHYALVAVMCHNLGVEMDPAFGMAPSTRHHHQLLETPCAR